MATDATEKAVGSVFWEEVMYEELDPHLIHNSIAHKEWLALEWTTKKNMELVRNKVISWHVDNTNVRFAWLRSRTVGDVW